MCVRKTKQLVKEMSKEELEQYLERHREYRLPESIDEVKMIQNSLGFDNRLMVVNLGGEDEPSRMLCVDIRNKKVINISAKFKITIALVKRTKWERFKDWYVRLAEKHFGKDN